MNDTTNLSERIDGVSVVQRKYLNPPDVTPYDPSRLQTFQEIFEAAKDDILREEKSPHARRVSREDLAHLILQCMNEVDQLEIAARNPERSKLTVGFAKRVKRIVRFSAPGDYYRPSKNDRYEKFDWAMNMDRIADDEAALLGIRIAGLVTGQDFSAFEKLVLLDQFNPQLNAMREQVRKAISDSGIKFVYIGRPDEINAIKHVLLQKESFIPEESVDLIGSFTAGENITVVDNTYHQVKAFREYQQTHPVENGVDVLVDFAPRMARELHILQERNNTHPPQLAIWPIASPKPAQDISRELETRGTAAYAIRGWAALDSHPAQILGAK